MHVLRISEGTECVAWDDVTEVPKLTNVSDFHNTYASWGNPIIITDVAPYMFRNYTVEKFMEYYEANEEQFDTDLCEVSSADESVNTIRDYSKVLKKLGPDAPSIRW